jgi:acyl carrier protein
MDILTELKELAAKQFGAEPASVDVDAPIDKLGIDSLGFLEFLFEAEDKFGISIPQDQVTGVKTLRELGALIERLRAEPKPVSAEPKPANG